MLVQTREQADVTIFQVKGRLDSSTTPELEQSVLNWLEKGLKKLVMDFSELEYINSAGLRILVMSYQRLQPVGGQVIICGARDYISEIFDISGYNRIFPMVSSLDQVFASPAATTAIGR